MYINLVDGKPEKLDVGQKYKQYSRSFTSIAIENRKNNSRTPLRQSRMHGFRTCWRDTQKCLAGRMWPAFLNLHNPELDTKHFQEDLIFLQLPYTFSWVFLCLYFILFECGVPYLIVALRRFLWAFILVDLTIFSSKSFHLSNTISHSKIIQRFSFL